MPRLTNRRRRRLEHRDGFTCSASSPGYRARSRSIAPGRRTWSQHGDLPVAEREINGAQLADYLEQIRPAFAIVELVGAMPKQGVSSTFQFGRAFGTVLGVLAAPSRAGSSGPAHAVTTARSLTKLVLAPAS